MEIMDMMQDNPIQLEADYLIIGAGASGLAFADELIHGTSNLTVVIVDKNSKPGGHWNSAYSFVTLHQPAAFYGVNSRPLGNGGRDLATLSEICTYYEQVMKDLVQTGRVKYFPQCEYKGEGNFESMLEKGLKYNVHVNRKTVNATFISPSIPSTSKPEFGFTEDVNLVPVNGLAYNQFAWNNYTIIGGGKTGIDAVLFLIDNNVDPNRITWIIPNDFWLLNRNFIFTDNFVDSSMAVMNCVFGCETHEELFKRWENIGWFLRLDKNVEPRNLKGASVTPEELEKLQRVRNVVRKGRIHNIEPTRIIFRNGGEQKIDDKTLNVDCTANGSPVFTPQKIFNGDNITLQDVRQLQAVYSASLIAAFEYYYPNDEEKKNNVLKPIPHCQTAIEYMVGLKDNLINENAVLETIGLRWLRGSRLNWIHHISLCTLVRYLWFMKRNMDKLYESVDKIVARIEKLNLK